MLLGEVQMSATLAVPDELLKSVSDFVQAEKMALDVVAGEEGTVRVVQSGKRRQSTISVLEAGGWITCATARGMAPKLGITLQAMGKLLNHLDIRIRACELGCFD
jgi:hypothetical protein